MRPEGCEPDLLRALAAMPFLHRLEMVAVSGWSRGAVYEAIERLESGGFCASVLHATELLPQARRFHLTAAGLRRLADEEGIALEELVRARPVSAQWRRSLMERLDALAAVYSVASAVSDVAFPVRFRWYRAAPLDAAMTLPDGKTVGVVRQGLTADRSGFAKRVWRLRDWPMPGTALILVADDVRLRHARRALSTTDVPALFALEREAVLAGAGDRIWSPPRVSASIDLRRALERAAPGGGLPQEPEPERADAPTDFAVEGPGWDIPDHMLPVLLKSAEKRALDLISDWPWIALKELAGLLDVSAQRASRIVILLEGFGQASAPATRADAWPSPTGGWPYWPAGTAPPSPWRGAGGASPPKTPKVRWSGTTSPAGGPASCSGTSSTPPPSTASWPRSPRRPASWGGRSFSSTRPGGPPATSGTTAGCAPSTPTPSASSEKATHAGPSSWSGSAAPCGPQPCRCASPPICSALLLIPPARRRPRHTAIGPGRLRRRDRPHPLPARGAGRDPRIESQRAPVGVPQGGRGRPGAAGTRLAQLPATRSRPRPCRPNERRVTREAHAYTRRPQAERPPEAQRTDRRPARRGGPLEAARAAEPLPELARQGDRGQPRLRVDAGQRGASALRSHPPPDAQGPGTD